MKGREMTDEYDPADKAALDDDIPDEEFYRLYLKDRGDGVWQEDRDVDGLLLMLESVRSHPEEYLTEEDREALRIGKQSRKRKSGKKVRRLVLAAAAAFACMLMMAVGSEANRIRLIGGLNTLIGGEVHLRISNEDDIYKVSQKEKEARSEIREKLGAAPPELTYVPKGLIYDACDVNGETGQAFLYYRYQDSVLSVFMKSMEEQAAFDFVQAADAVDSFEVSTKLGEITVIRLEGAGAAKYMTEFVFQNTVFRIQGELPEEEFVKMLEGMMV